jgi:hypothetical protein
MRSDSPQATSGRANQSSSLPAAARSHARPALALCRDLRPSAGWIEDRDEAFAGEFQLFRQMLLEIDAVGTCRLEPRGSYEVGDEHAANLVAQAVVFDGIANLERVDPAVGPHGAPVDPRIGEHFEEFMAQSGRPRTSVFDIELGKDLPQRSAAAGHFVIAQRTGLVGIVRDNNLPPTARWWLAVRQEDERAIKFPVGFEVVAYLFLQRRKYGLHLQVGQAGGGVGDGDDGKGNRNPAPGFRLLVREHDLGAS